jgi:hypothetical protein
MKLKLLLAVALALAAPLAAIAQAPPQPPPTASIAGVLSFSVTNASGQQALPADSGGFPAVTFYNRGTKDAFFKFGPSSSVVATTTPTGVGAGKVPAGTRLTVWTGSGNKNLAMITAGTDTTTVEAYQSTGPMDFGLLGTGGGAGADCSTITNAACLNAANTYTTAGASAAPVALYNGALFTGGGTTNTLPMILASPSSAVAATTWNNAGTFFGVNAASGFSGLFLDFHVNGGASVFSVASNGAIVANGNITGNGSLFASGTSNIQWTSRGILTSPAAGSIKFGAADAAAPVAQTIATQSVVAGTTNTAGANATIIGSLSTGSGASGDIIFQTGGTGAGATVQNTATTALTIKGATQTVQVASGKALQLGNAFVATPATPTGTLLLTDSAGAVYKIPACLASGC